LNPGFKTECIYYKRGADTKMLGSKMGPVLTKDGQIYEVYGASRKVLEVKYQRERI